jgi:N-acylglucosamine 2-epimerase
VVSHYFKNRAYISRKLLETSARFWMRYGIDREFGGVGNMLDDEGNRVGTDKYLWSQGRALWTFSALCNRIEPRDEWRAAADHVFEYLLHDGRDDYGRWMYRLDSAGKILDRDISIYVDGFVMNGLGEYFRLTRDPRAKDLALQTYDATITRLNTPGSYGVAPYEIPPRLKTHGIAMLFSHVLFHLGHSLDRPDITQEGLKRAGEIFRDFYVQKKDAILEFVSLDGSFVDSPQGRACVPGHALESMWFAIEIFERTNQPQRIAECCRLIRRHIELAWDDDFGGLFLALDIDGQSPAYWQKADCKPWWVQVEAMVACVYAYVHTREVWFLEQYDRISAYALAHYPTPAGEWTQWLDRRGNKMASAALPVKDPFHLPRGLMVLIDLFENRLGRSTTLS